jgi:hypothetical protein
MAEKINLQKSLSKTNEALIHLFDQSGLRRSLTVPYIDGQEMADHIDAVNQAVKAAGGLGANLLMTAHHSDGKGFGSGDGHTVAHGVDALRGAIIPKDDENAKAVLSAAQSHLNNIAKLLGDDNPVVKTANGQLALAKKSNAAGMNSFDFGVFITQLMAKPNQAISQAFSGVKDGGHSSKLRGPGKNFGADEAATESQNGQEESAGGESQPAPDAGSPPADAAASAAPDAQAAPAGASAAPQAQGS